MDIKKNFWKIVLLVFICTIIIFSVANIEEVLHQIGRLISILTPFIIAFFLAYLLQPFVNSIKKLLNKVIFHGNHLRVCNIISIVIVYMVVVFAITLTIIYIAPQISRSLSELLDNLPQMYKSSVKYVVDLKKNYPNGVTTFIYDKVMNYEEDLVGFGTEMIRRLFPVVYSVSVSIVSLTVNIILAIVISCYMISDKVNMRGHIKRAVYAFVPKGKVDGVWDTLRECNSIFSGFLIGKTIDSLIIGVLCFIIMSIIGLPYAVLISVIVGITNMIPYFGPFIGAVPGVFIFLFVNPKDALIFAIMILLLQQFDGLYLGPKILGDSTGLKPLWVIFAITVGGAYFGVLGMFLGVPVVAVIAYLVDILIKKLLKSKGVEHID